MNKLWKVLLSTLVVSLAVCLCAGMSVFAASQGTYAESDTVFWKMDANTGTLTISGSGAIPDDAIPDEIDSDTVKNIVVADGITDAFGLDWEMADRSVTLGKDVWVLPYRLYLAVSVSVSEENPFYKMYDGCLYNDDYSELLYCAHSRDSVDLHPNVQVLKDTNIFQAKAITLSPENQSFAFYEGCLYTKDYRTLVYCPVYRPSTRFHPNLTTIGERSISRMEGTDTVVIPWGVTTLRPYALLGIFGIGLRVALPDTLTSVEMYDPMDGLVIDREITVLYSNKNQVMIDLRGMPTEEQQKAWASCYSQQGSNPVTPAKKGWVQEGGKWYYYLNGQKATGWQMVGPTWYYLDTNGIMQTGWITTNGTKYLLRDWGGMAANGWYQIGSKWYYFNSWGGMVKNSWIYGLDKKWYYVGADGVMLTNTKTPDGYWVNANGVWVR